MKNKIFLTSVFAVMLACPAFSADIPAGTTTENCIGSPIYNITEGTVYYTADWTAHVCEITLDPNINGGADASATQSTLYTRYEDGAYLTSADRTNRSNLMTTSANGLPSARVPLGKEIVTTWDTNAPVDPTSTSVPQARYSIAAIPNSEPRLEFQGFWNAASSPTEKYISESSTHYLVGNGPTIAAGLYKSHLNTSTNEYECPETTWYAKWSDCATRTAPADPSVTGYTFGGWYTSSNPGSGDSAVDLTQSANQCTSANQTLYAKWNKKTYTVSYNCNPDNIAGNTSTLSGTSPASATGTDTATYDEQYTWLTCGAWAGHTMTGWSCTLHGTNTDAGHTSGDYWKVDSDVDCVAQWDTNTINLRWNSDGGTAVNTPLSCEYGTTDGITGIQQPTKLGYTFAGWRIDHTTNP